VIDINIDGLPLFKSSRAQLWSISFGMYNRITIEFVTSRTFVFYFRPLQQPSLCTSCCEVKKQILEKNGKILNFLTLNFIFEL